jgi:toxin-antitoxin system PIN domain toxin
VNLLVYARSAELPQHEVAHRWLDDRLNAQSRVGLPWESLVAFVRVVSNPKILERPESITRAWQQVETWLATRRTWVPLPTTHHRATLRTMLSAVGRADDVPDAVLAALAVEHGLVLMTTDRGFGRFPGLRWENPLARA